MEATVSSWIVSSELSGSHNLTASDWKHKDSCFHHLQHFFWNGTLSHNFIYIMYPFVGQVFVFWENFSFPYTVRDCKNWIVSQISGPLDDTFSSWILSNEPSGSQILRVLSLRHKDSCIYHKQTIFLEGSIVQKLYLLFVCFWPPRFVFLNVLGLLYFVRYLNRAFWLSMWCRSFDISILLCSFGVLWRPRSRHGSCQVGYIVPASWEPPISNIRSAVSIICKLCLWRATLSDNLIWVFLIYPFD